MFDALGQLVQSQNVKADSRSEIELGESGIYTIVITDYNGDRTVGRVVVNK